MNIELDVHTHTVASGHAFSTLLAFPAHATLFISVISTWCLAKCTA